MKHDQVRICKKTFEKIIPTMRERRAESISSQREENEKDHEMQIIGWFESSELIGRYQSRRAQSVFKHEENHKFHLLFTESSGTISRHIMIHFRRETVIFIMLLQVSQFVVSATPKNSQFDASSQGHHVVRFGKRHQPNAQASTSAKDGFDESFS